MRDEPHRWSAFGFVALIAFQLLSAFAASRSSTPPDDSAQFNRKTETARHYAIGKLVLERLAASARPPEGAKMAWKLRVVDNDQFNAFSSPDGSIYVESGLAELVGPSSGLWAAVLSHEIVHVVRRDQARRNLYQTYLESGVRAAQLLGDRSLPSAPWFDSEKAAADMGRFNRQMELEADREGLMLMAQAGYHPDFVPALHHLLHARASGAPATSLYATHPCWEERDHELSRAYEAASIEFARRWPEWYASPGGNPPVVVFAEEPTVRKTGPAEWEIRIPIRCQNLAGAVEVVLHSGSKQKFAGEYHRDRSDTEIRQLTGCTSPRTTITFTLGDSLNHKESAERWTDVYVLDAWGVVLARADIPKLRH